MEALDTVLTKQQRKGIILVDALLDKQAEISFKAGIKEVVEFCQANQMPDKPEGNPYPGMVIISKERWQVKLKEWGIEK